MRRRWEANKQRSHLERYALCWILTKITLQSIIVRGNAMDCVVRHEEWRRDVEGCLAPWFAGKQVGMGFSMSWDSAIERLERALFIRIFRIHSSVSIRCLSRVGRWRNQFWLFAPPHQICGKKKDMAAIFCLVRPVLLCARATCNRCATRSTIKKSVNVSKKWARQRTKERQQESDGEPHQKIQTTFWATGDKSTVIMSEMSFPLWPKSEAHLSQNANLNLNLDSML